MSKPHVYYLIFDWETGGLSSNKNPVVELAMIAVRGDDFEEIGRIDKIILPYDSSGATIEYDFEDNLIREIKSSDSEEIQEFYKEANKLNEDFFDFTYTEGAMKAHKIKPDQIKRRGVVLNSVVDNIIELANSAKVNNFSKAVLVGHNVDFDKSFIHQVFDVTKKSSQLSKIFDGKEDYYGNFHPHCIDTIDLAKLKWHKNEGEISRYNLQTCCDKAGIDLVGAHRAMNDVVSTKDLFLSFKKSIRSKSSSQIKEVRDRDKIVLEF